MIPANESDICNAIWLLVVDRAIRQAMMALTRGMALSSSLLLFMILCSNH